GVGTPERPGRRAGARHGGRRSAVWRGAVGRAPARRALSALPPPGGSLRRQVPLWPGALAALRRPGNRIVAVCGPAGWPPRLTGGGGGATSADGATPVRCSGEARHTRPPDGF